MFTGDNGQALLLSRKADITKGSKWLVVDEIGRINRTPFSDETMGEIIDTRYHLALKESGDDRAYKQ